MNISNNFFPIGDFPAKKKKKRFVCHQIINLNSPTTNSLCLKYETWFNHAEFSKNSLYKSIAIVIFQFLSLFFNFLIFVT